MENLLAFLDFLASKEIKDAFLSGRCAFVLDSNGHDLLWLNGKAAHFFGFFTLSKALDRVPFFDIAVSRQLETGLRSGRSIRLRGEPQPLNFLLSRVSVPEIGEVILAQSAEHVSRYDPASLIAGLAEKDISVAIFDENNHAIATSDNFVGFDDTIGIFLRSIDNRLPAKTVVKREKNVFQLSAIRLREDPFHYLVLVINISDLASQTDSEDKNLSEKEEQSHFTWKMDENGRFSDFSEPFLRQVDLNKYKLVNRCLNDLAADFREHAFLELADKVEKSLPWNDVKLQLPIGADRGEVFTFFLSGMPVFTLNGELTGFRGFGTVAPDAYVKLTNPSIVIEDEVSKSGLSSDERSAFREIAERLRSELNLSTKEQPATQITVAESVISLPVCDEKVQAFTPERSAILNLLDTATDGVIWLDNDGDIYALSDAASALTGYDKQDVLTLNFSSLFTSSTRDTIENYMSGLHKSGAKRLFNRGESAEINTKDGTAIKVFVTLVPLSSLEGYAALLRDMTNVAPQAQLQFDTTSLAETIHEIRTPLNAMIGFADIMREERFGAIENERYRGYLRDIISSGKHILTLVNRFLDKAKNYHNNKDKAGHNAQNGRFDVIAQLRKSVALLENQANDNGIIMRIVLPPRVPEITIDAQEFRQVIWNLLSNSIRFTASGGQIVVHLAYTGADFIKISISDNGIGMTEDEMARAIEPYGQIARKDGRNGDAVFVGTGLGLPTAKSLVEKNGGRFLLLSKPNQGTTVELFFPISKMK